MGKCDIFIGITGTLGNKQIRLKNNIKRRVDLQKELDNYKVVSYNTHWIFFQISGVTDISYSDSAP